MSKSPVVEQKPESIRLNLDLQFAAPVYTVEMPKFLPSVKKISAQLLREKSRELGRDKNPQLLMTDNFFLRDEVAPFTQFVGQTAWNILSEQGYAVDTMDVVFEEMWVQQHHKHSLMEQHTHRFGSQIVGFYFLEVPDPAPQAVFYDTRIGALQGGLPEKDQSRLTLASPAVTYNPKPGLMIFTNSWLAHSLSRNLSNKPFSFVHFNLTAVPSIAQRPEVSADSSEVEVI